MFRKYHKTMVTMKCMRLPVAGYLIGTTGYCWEILIPVLMQYRRLGIIIARQMAVIIAVKPAIRHSPQRGLPCSG